MPMHPDDLLTVTVLKADGSFFRTWQATVERLEPGLIVTWSPVGHVVRGVTRDWTARHAIRSFYWLDRPYNLLEVYNRDGSLYELYVHIASRPSAEDGRLSFIDHELDVVLYPDGAAQIIDQDEFAQAALDYGYSAQFQAACYQAAEAAVALVQSWTPEGSREPEIDQ